MIDDRLLERRAHALESTTYFEEYIGSDLFSTSFLRSYVWSLRPVSVSPLQILEQPSPWETRVGTKILHTTPPRKSGV